MVSGIVNNIWTKEVKTRNGMASVYLMSLEGEDRTFNLQFKKPGVEVGDEVTFSDKGEKYGEWQVDLSSLKIASRGNATSAAVIPEKKAAPAGGGGGYSKGKFPLPIDDGQRCILRQHAFTQASLVFHAHYEDEMGEGAWNPAESVEQVIQLAYRIENYTSGDDVREEMSKTDE